VDVGAGDYLLATVDMLVEDVHFRRDRPGAFEVGRRAVAVNVSDIAAMGGEPRFALTSIALPPALPLRWAEGLYRGIRHEADLLGVGVIGGNTARTSGPLTLDVTLLGRVAKPDLVRRSGARVGDVLAVTGTLGGATAARLLQERPGGAASDLEESRRYSVPEPRVAAGRALASLHLAHAMLDISDGLASDVGHLAEASEVGAVIYEERLPISSPTRRIAQHLSDSPRDLALFGGEDYELLVALPEGAVEPARRALGQLPLTVVGHVLPQEQGVVLERGGGTREPLGAGGWRHF